MGFNSAFKGLISYMIYGPLEYQPTNEPTNEITDHLFTIQEANDAD